MSIRRSLPLLLVAALLAQPAAAERRAVCKRACTAAVAGCAAATALRPARARRLCRKTLYRRCRRQGVTACAQATTTTTTIRLTPATTTTTSTTLPVVRSYAGTWTFVGYLSDDSCGASGGLADTFTIAQDGTALSITIGSLPGVVLSGTVTGDGFEAAGTFFDGGCRVDVALAALNDGTVVLTAGTGFAITCGGASCQSIWVGQLRR